MELARCEMFAIYLINNKSTIRKTANYFGVSKSLVHNDVSKKLPLLNKTLYKKLKVILNINFNEKHIRGGMATREKFKKALVI